VRFTRHHDTVRKCFSKNCPQRSYLRGFILPLTTRFRQRFVILHHGFNIAGTQNLHAEVGGLSKLDSMPGHRVVKNSAMTSNPRPDPGHL